MRNRLSLHATRLPWRVTRLPWRFTSFLPRVAASLGSAAPAAVCVWLALCAGRPLGAATVLSKTVEADIHGDGSLVERTHLEVRIDSAADVPSWSRHAVAISETRELGEFSAWVRQADGRTIKVGRDGFDTADAAGGEILTSSHKVRWVRLPGVTQGAVVGIDYEWTEHPYFPVAVIAVGGADAIASLRVHVRGGGAGWRWRIDGRTPALAVAEAPGEVTITASGLAPRSVLEREPDEDRRGPVLYFGWGAAATWADVGRWYDGIAGDLPRGRQEVRQAALGLFAAGGASAGAAAAGVGGAATASGAERRRRLDSVLAFLRRDVRYVAVELGVGGYRPAAAHETLARRWGDCKAKAALLLDMLAAAGIEGYPALIRPAPAGRIDPEFPTATVFNHMIVALPVAGLDIAAGDPVAGGYLFVDPTQERGGLGWLYPGDQDQWALVLRGGRSELVRTPLLPQLETTQLSVELTARPDGGAAGHLQLDLNGAQAAAQIERMGKERPEVVETEARRLVAAWLPAATISALRWQADTKADIPRATLTAEVALPLLVATSAAAGAPDAAGPAAAANAAGAADGGVAHWLALGGPMSTPAPGLLRNREVPIVFTPQVVESRWRIALPAGWCPDQSDQTAADGDAVGAFSQSLRCDGGTLVVVRRTELRQRWVDPGQFAGLSKVALAEHRAAARRLRLDRLRG